VRTFTRLPAACARAARAGRGLRHRPHPALRRLQVARRGRHHHPRLHRDGWRCRDLQRVRLPRPDKPIRDYTETELHDFLYKEPTKIKVAGINLTYEGLIPKIQKSFLSKDRRLAAAAHPRVRGAGGHLHRLSRLRRHPAQRGGPVVEDRRDQHRRRLRHADQRPRRLGAGPRRAVGGAAAHRARRTPSTRSSRSASATSASTGRRARCRAARRSAPR
jgi:hypothetical protein